jgi:hypothetical protein
MGANQSQQHIINLSDTSYAKPTIMMGGGTKSASFVPDISNYKDLNLLLIIVTAITILDVIVLFFARYFPDWLGEPLNKWYDKFEFLAVLSDVLIIAIGFILAQVTYTHFFSEKYGWNVWIFLALLVGIQVVHDLIFYFGVIKPLPEGHNKMIDIFKEYAASGGWKILFGDAILMLGSALIAFALKDQSPFVIATAGIGALYTMPYILNTRWKGDKKEKFTAPVKQEQQEQQQAQQQQAQPRTAVEQVPQGQHLPAQPTMYGGDVIRTGAPHSPYAQDNPYFNEPVPASFYN